MTAAVRAAVRKRAKNRCEYCRADQDQMPFSRHQVEHVRPRQHGGDDHLNNLALACYRCNKFKGPNLTAFDPRTGKVARLFNPRRQRWTDHFVRRGELLLGRTATGRATVEPLRMNDIKVQRLRREIREQGQGS